MKKEEILALCIEEIRSGKSTIADCIKRYPELGKELASLLEIAAGLKAEEANPSMEFKQRAKRYLFERMQETPAKVPHGLSFWPKQTLGRVLASVLTGIVILGAAGGGTVYAAQGSLPGDVLYPVKTGVENLQLAVIPDTTAKANLHLQLAQRRVDEAAQQIELNRSIDIQALGTVKKQLDSAIIELSKSGDTQITSDTLSHLSTVTLNQQVELQQVLANAPQSSQPAIKQAISETRRGNTIAQVAYANHDFLHCKPSVADEQLDVGQFKIEGILISVQDSTWNIGGTILNNVDYSGKVPDTGSRVRLQGIVKDNKVFINRIEVDNSSPAPTTLEGQFGGVNENGTTNVGGINVQIEDNNSTQLEPGDTLTLQGMTGIGKMSVTGRENRPAETEVDTTLDGILTAVDTTNNTITIKVAGDQILINISDAGITIKNGGKQKAGIGDLSKMIGNDVRVKGIVKKNSMLFAQSVYLGKIRWSGNSMMPTTGQFRGNNSK